MSDVLNTQAIGCDWTINLFPFNPNDLPTFITPTPEELSLNSSDLVTDSTHNFKKKVRQG